MSFSQSGTLGSRELDRNQGIEEEEGSKSASWQSLEAVKTQRGDVFLVLLLRGSQGATGSWGRKII